MTTQSVGGSRAAFTAFVEAHEPSLRRALVAALGAERGREAAAEALAYAWENWARVAGLDNPPGYLYRLGLRKGRRMAKPRTLFPRVDAESIPWVEPGLPAALASLSERQRAAVVLVHGFGYRHREAADVLGISATSVQNHVERGLKRLRSALGSEEAT